MATTLNRIDYLINLCDQSLKNSSNPPLILNRISQDTRKFLKFYGNKNIFEMIKKANDFRDKALNVYEYRCIKYSMFIMPRMNRTSRFKTDITPKLLSSKKTSILDIGCCFGTDLRYCLFVGCHKEQILGVDISQDFINLGFEFFNDKHQLNDRFITMNVLDENGKNFIDLALKLNNNKKFDVIHIGNIYHLLTENDCKLLTKIASSLLVDKNGIIFGGTVGVESKPGVYRRRKGNNKQHKMRYLHNKDSLRTLFENDGNFKCVSVSINNRSVQKMTQYRKPISGETHYTYLNFYVES